MIGMEQHQHYSSAGSTGLNHHHHHHLMDVDPPLQQQHVMVAVSASNAGAWPFPAKDPMDGALTACYLNVDGADNKQLKEWCRTYGLGVSGRKSELVKRLQDFSNDTDKWKSYQPSKRRMHRNPHTDGQPKSTSVKKSTKRAQAAFPDREAQPSAHLPNILPGVPLRGVQEKKKALQLWAAETSARYPYVPKEERAKAAEIFLQKSRAAMGAVGTESTPDLLKETNLRLDELSALILDRRRLTSADTSPPLANSQPLFVGHTPIPCPIPPPAATQNTAVTGSLCLAMPTRTIDLNGRSLTFAEADVGPPPAHTFAADPPFTLEMQLRRLNAIWDFDPVHWRGLDTGLTIQGTPIPLAYLRDVFATRRGAKSQTGHVWKPNQWKGVKNTWLNWRDIIVYWRQGGEDAFWTTFSSTTGERLPYSKILDRITEHRNTKDVATAVKAKHEYSTDFDTVFWYKKTGQKIVMTQDRAIARKYRLLKNQPTQGDDDDDWV
ncbi:hypothetical protein CPB83DRAFT_865495 [Crepidotus variabilis]|uniref:SAP domain-containing protein n=1 Tax=Crepidotus variabilis TaxID=179855 RepID=A0A9P6BBH4_9AGAR|nr:hypothetical protein CPB83DRAFT_865495 [Crepidotus variabilis]